MTEEKRQSQLAYLRAQKENPTGNYRRYLCNVHKLIAEDAANNGLGWSRASSRRMMRKVYEGEPDHMGEEMVDRWKKDLCDLGYLELKIVDGVWRFYVVKEIDF